MKADNVENFAQKNSPELDGLRITEIFYSLQGESSNVGIPTIFIRLTGCPLRCTYCDTEYAFNGGEIYTIDSIVKEISKYDSDYITITGGEPLAQKRCLALIDRLCSTGYQVSLETSGAFDIESIHKDVKIIMDIKTPSSNESGKNLYNNIQKLKAKDEIKFVISDYKDYEWAKNLINKYHLTSVCVLLFSPEHTSLAPNKLADWILKDGLKVRMQIQMHKYIWGMEPGH
jgi:7-carboxy-7-deazaguanine synthase